MKHVVFDIAGAPLAVRIDGPTIVGGRETLLDSDDDLTLSAPWSASGFTVQAALDQSHQEDLEDRLACLLKQLFVDCDMPRAPERLTDYHRFASDAVHEKIVALGQRGIPVSRLGEAGERVAQRISEIARVPVTASPPLPNSLPPQLRDGFFCLRIVRPGHTTDCNPPHRDAWLDRLRHSLALYLPIAGSDERSSLPIAPGSHLWSESDFERTIGGAVVNGRAYTVPGITECQRPLTLIRPDPKPGEVLVFSPYLVHGGGINLNPGSTRISLEMRFWRA